MSQAQIPSLETSNLGTSCKGDLEAKAHVCKRAAVGSAACPPFGRCGLALEEFPQLVGQEMGRPGTHCSEDHS